MLKRVKVSSQAHQEVLQARRTTVRDRRLGQAEKIGQTGEPTRKIELITIRKSGLMTTQKTTRSEPGSETGRLRKNQQDIIVVLSPKDTQGLIGMVTVTITTDMGLTGMAGIATTVTATEATGTGIETVKTVAEGPISISVSRLILQIEIEGVTRTDITRTLGCLVGGQGLTATTIIQATISKAVQGTGHARMWRCGKAIPRSQPEAASATSRK